MYMSYEEKYLKYKNKYLTLKNQIGGSSVVPVIQSKNDFTIPVVDATSTPKQIETAMNDLVNEVRCPICLSNIKSVVICTKGHSVCNHCTPTIGQTCPICRGPKLENPRNIL